jgi:hypothetical protein
MPDHPTCETCRYWQEADRPFGVCRRYAPRANTSIGLEAANDGEHEWPYARWPETERSDWCGEHEPVNEGDNA